MNKHMAPKLPILPCFEASGVTFGPDFCSYVCLLFGGGGHSRVPGSVKVAWNTTIPSRNRAPEESSSNSSAKLFVDNVLDASRWWGPKQD